MVVRRTYEDGGDNMNYKQRLDLLIDYVGGATLNDKEFKVIYDVLELSRRRVDNDREYNKGIDEAINNLRLGDELEAKQRIIQKGVSMCMGGK